jgi:hypothetical protein
LKSALAFWLFAVAIVGIAFYVHMQHSMSRGVRGFAAALTNTVSRMDAIVSVLTQSVKVDYSLSNDAFTFQSGAGVSNVARTNVAAVARTNVLGRAVLVSCEFGDFLDSNARSEMTRRIHNELERAGATNIVIMFREGR